MTEPDALSIKLYVAALAGSVVGLRALPGASWLERASNLVSGSLVAAYVGPAIVDYLRVSSPRVACGMTFAIGAAGLVIFAALIDGIKQTPVAQIIQSWLQRRGGNGTGST